MRPTDDFVVSPVDRLRERGRGGRLLPQGVGLGIDHPVLGADGTGTAHGADVTTQDPRPVLKSGYTDDGDGTWKATVGVVGEPAHPGHRCRVRRGGPHVGLADRPRLEPGAGRLRPYGGTAGGVAAVDPVERAG